jgi:hypothetical protein
MRKFLKYAYEFLFPSSIDAEEEYLSKATDLADLERRMRQLERARLDMFKNYYM